MPRLKLTYFDFDGGRGEPARLALVLSGIEFEDRRIPLAEWESIRGSTPFHALPVLEVDGLHISQCNTINRYVGKLGDLYPADPLQAALCDEVMDAVEDISTKVAVTIQMEDGPEKKAARERLASGPIPLYLKGLGAQLQQRGAKYFADGRLTVADLKVFNWIRHLRSGALDHIPKDLPERTAPLLVAHFERLNADPRIAAYYERRAARQSRATR